MLISAAFGLFGCAPAESVSERSPAATASTTEPASASPIDCFEHGREVPGIEGAVRSGTGSTAVVFVNGAAESPCAWAEFGALVVAAGHQIFAYHSLPDGPLEQHQAHLRDVVTAAGAAGAERVVLVGGSRGGCLSLVEASMNADIDEIAVLSCARVWNRSQPVDLAGYLPNVRQPVFEVIASDDPDVTTDEVQDDFEALADATLMEVDGRAHGSALLSNPVVAEALMDLVNAG